MAEIVPLRLLKAMAEEGLTQSELAQLVGLSQPSIGRLLSGETRQSKSILEIARALKRSPEYLVGESDDPSPTRIVVPSARSESVERDSLTIAEIDLAYGMGGTFIDDVPVNVAEHRFPREWVRAYTKAPADQLFFARGAGDSMMPTLHDSDLLLFDRQQTNLVMADKIWAFAYGGVGMIKRLRPMADGSLKIISDNPAIPEELAFDGEVNVIGRMVAMVRKF